MRYNNLMLVASVAFFAVQGLVMCSSPHAEGTHSSKEIATLWYEAFDKNDPMLLDKILNENWVDIPAAPGQSAGPQGAKQILLELTTAFPDLKITIKEILYDGNKVVVRSEISGIQKETLMGFPAKNRQMAIQAIDIHELKDGKIVRTWHTEDWLTGLHHLGVFDK